MFKLVHIINAEMYADRHPGGHTVLCSNGKWKLEAFVRMNRATLKTWKTRAGAERAAAEWNAATGDYCTVHFA